MVEVILVMKSETYEEAVHIMKRSETCRHESCILAGCSYVIMVLEHFALLNMLRTSEHSCDFFETLEHITGCNTSI